MTDGAATTDDMDLVQFEYWRSQAVAFRDDVPTSDIECLAFAAHYGLATRLLDWSRNPLVALFFAVESCSKPDGVVWLHLPSYPVLYNTNLDLPASKDFCYQPRAFDRRIAAQSGLFTYHNSPSVELAPKKISLGDYLRALPEHELDLCRVVIPGNEKLSIKVRLQEMGVSRRLLFPDLDGLSGQVNWITERYVDIQDAGHTPDITDWQRFTKRRS